MSHFQNVTFLGIRFLGMYTFSGILYYLCISNLYICYQDDIVDMIIKLNDLVFYFEIFSANFYFILYKYIHYSWKMTKNTWSFNKITLSKNTRNLKIRVVSLGTTSFSTYQDINFIKIILANLNVSLTIFVFTYTISIVIVMCLTYLLIDWYMF